MMRAPLNIEEFKRDGVHQIFLADHVHQKSLAAGNVEGIDHAQQRRQHEDVPHLHRSGKGQGRKNQGQNHGCDLGSDDHSLPVVPVGHDAAQRGHQKHRKLAGESHRAQQSDDPVIR